MSTCCHMRKRIWEVDCVSMDSVLAASFDWKDLANLLQGFGIPLPLKGNENILATQAHNLIHRYCHSENKIALAVERLLNILHEHTLKQIQHLEVREVMDFAITFQFSRSKRLGGIYWALGTDGRNEFDSIRRRFHQRFQIQALRDLALRS